MGVPLRFGASHTHYRLRQPYQPITVASQLDLWERVVACRRADGDDQSGCVFRLRHREALRRRTSYYLAPARDINVAKKAAESPLVISHYGLTAILPRAN